MPSEDTKERILDAAEQIFGERGFAGTSLRAVTSAAGVNLAAVHYHFGSKEALLEAAFHRRVEPINRERLERLDALESRPGGEPPEVEEILEAFLRPVIRLESDPDAASGWVRPFTGRLYGEPREHVAPFLRREFEEVTRRFLGAFHRALPGLPSIELEWRFQFVVAVMIFVITGSFVSVLDAGREPQAPDPEEILGRMVAFLAAGLRASRAAPPRRGAADGGPRAEARPAPPVERPAKASRPGRGRSPSPEAQHR